MAGSININITLLVSLASSEVSCIKVSKTLWRVEYYVVVQKITIMLLAYNILTHVLDVRPLRVLCYMNLKHYGGQ